MSAARGAERLPSPRATHRRSSPAHTQQSLNRLHLSPPGETMAPASSTLAGKKQWQARSTHVRPERGGPPLRPSRYVLPWRNAPRRMDLT